MFKGNEHLHFIGICGIGMSGIAKILLAQGYKVSGCDKNIDPQRAQELQNLGCIINQHLSETCFHTSIDIVVHSSDVALNHPEIIAARYKNIPVLLRAQILAEIMRSKFCIAVAGAHGKTTTSSLLAHVLLQAQTNPTIIVGGHIHQINSNAQLGSGKFLVAESDESDRSFLLLPKTFSIVTNIDREHLNTYKDFDDIKQSFIQFMNQLPFYGFNIICLDDPGIQSVLESIQTRYFTYGTNPQANFHIQDIQLSPDNSSFNVTNTITQQNLGQFTVALPGLHNVLNATSIIALCHHLEINTQAVKNTLKSFQGVDRRFTLKGISSRHGAKIFDDYGHHPTEIKVTLQVARTKTSGKVIVVFQPQRFSRTFHLWNDFISVLSQAPVDELILTDIYPANEQPIDGVSSPNLVNAIKKANPSLKIRYIPFTNNGQEIITELESLLSKNDLLLFQGAGKVNKLAELLLASPKSPNHP